MLSRDIKVDEIEVEDVDQIGVTIPQIPEEIEDEHYMSLHVMMKLLKKMEYGVDFSNTFAPMARHDTIRLLVALTVKMGWKIHYLDVKSAFLNGVLEKDIYVVKTKFTSSAKLSMA
ncbi:hypothetical protein AAG906_041096 [Vitis piasezkii]